MKLTPYHARYYAMLLARSTTSGSLERYLPTLMGANIDLDPHQIEAALFASRSQFRDGVILADEEGLGKTIEAGIALLQAAIEDKTYLLVLCPPTLLDHWKSELLEKFSLECFGLQDAKSKEGVVLLTYQEAQRNADTLAGIPWDLCVLDEAHRLANANLAEPVLSESIRTALSDRPKLLLTATPMQNSLLDLYHLIRFVDETAFGSDAAVFREKYIERKSLRDELAFPRS